MKQETRMFVAREVVAKFRENFSNAHHDLLTFAEVQDRLKSYAVDLELRWRTSQNPNPRGYEDPQVLELASEIISQEQTLRLKERRGDDSTKAPIISFSRASKDWLTKDQVWPERGYWLRYRRWMLGQRSSDVVTALDRDTNVILGRLGNPSDGARKSWDIRGLVVGQVQSGKTQNFVGLLAKAIDVGYRQIVVLSGVHEDLRSQTQFRIDQGITGQTFFDAADGGQGYQHRFVGVRESNPKEIALPPFLPFTSGSRENGDFSAAMASRATGVGDLVYIAVVKKTAARLKRLNETYSNLPELLVQPLILIDDEADQASVNNSSEDNPTKINEQIRTFLKQFPRSSYVGYTATPFAVIFGDPTHETETASKDLFPSDFIVRLAQGPGYFGPAELFGLRPVSMSDEIGKLPAESLIRIVDDVDAWLPPSKGRWPNCTPVPESLLESIADFLVGAAVKSWRRERNHLMTTHTTMLVNVPRVQEQQDQLVHALGEVRDQIRRDVSGDNTAPDSWFPRLHRSFVERILPNLIPGYDDPLPTWEDMSRRIGDLVERKLEVALVNGTVKDMLGYDNHASEGRLVIAVGGDKLSRGMTLEGLTVSYFLRRSNAWDTLLQMGRWFGYRHGYLDLCRLATTDLLLSRFNEVSQRIEELNRDLEDKFGQGEEPKDIGIYVRNSELSLLPTRRTALRGARLIKYLDRHSAREISRLRLAATDADRSETLDAARWLYREARAQATLTPPDRFLSDKRYEHTFFGVPCATIAEYVRRSLLQPIRGQSNELLSQNLLDLAKEGMVNEWVVSFPTVMNGRSPKVTLDTGIEIVPSERRRFLEKNGYLEGQGDVSDPRDIWVDFIADEVRHRGLTPKSDWSKIRSLAAEMRPERRGLLICYVLETIKGPSATWHISFPRMPREKEYEVLANPVALREIYGLEDGE